MDLNPSNATQLPAPDAPNEEPTSDISSDDPILKDKLACDQIEQVVVKAMEELVSECVVINGGDCYRGLSLAY